MGKYTDEAKLAAVRDYCSGEAGLKAVAQRHGVDVSSLRQWIAGYRAHGEEGVRAKKRPPTNFSAEFKLSVLKRMRDEGLSQRQREISSGVEHCIHTAGVASSKLAPPTRI